MHVAATPVIFCEEETALRSQYKEFHCCYNYHIMYTLTQWGDNDQSVVKVPLKFSLNPFEQCCLHNYVKWNKVNLSFLCIAVALHHEELQKFDSYPANIYVCTWLALL